jgi:putative thioredoxin
MTPEGREAKRLLSQLQFTSQAESLLPAVSGSQALAADPDDLDSRWATAIREAANGDYESALAHFLQIIQRDRKYRDDGGRRSMLAIFEILGPDHPLSMAYRPQLAATLH